MLFSSGGGALLLMPVDETRVLLSDKLKISFVIIQRMIVELGFARVPREGNQQRTSNHRRTRVVGDMAVASPGLLLASPNFTVVRPPGFYVVPPAPSLE